MKKIIKITSITLLIILFTFTTFILEESIRLSKIPGAKPLIITKIDANIEANNSKLKEEVYHSIGYTIKYEYLKDEKSSEDNIMYLIIGEEFRLFDKILIWAWIS